MRKRPGHDRTQRLRKLPGLHEKARMVSHRRNRAIRGASRRGAGVDEQAGLENRSPSRDRGFESHPLRHMHYLPYRRRISPHVLLSTALNGAGGIRTGVLKGVLPPSWGDRRDAAASPRTGPVVQAKSHLKAARRFSTYTVTTLCYNISLNKTC